MIIGTAGHVDHGKTALVKALTGVEGDRLKEEKARGITIDLGFAYSQTEAGHTLGFIDVPGHERFVHTMLAGACGIDFALLVVAADDGVMPQTIEHLAIIELLGIERGLIAVTKIDLVSDERVAQVIAQIRNLTAGTPLEQAKVLSVSTVTNQGVHELRRRLNDAAKVVRERSAASRFRLAVDRVFTLHGVGLVVTGTILSGRIRVGEEVTVSPIGVSARVRSLHAQNSAAESASAGDRCALNLAGDGISKQSIHRGAMVMDRYIHAPSDRIDASLRILPTEEKAIRQRFPVRLHYAATEVGAHVIPLGDQMLLPGDVADVQLVLEQPIPATAHDRFVIRDVSARRTIGGGIFIDLRPPPRKRRSPERASLRRALEIRDPSTSFSSLLAVPPFAWDLESFARDRALSRAETSRVAADNSMVMLEAGSSRFAMASPRWIALTEHVARELTQYHAENPDQQGIVRDKLRTRLKSELPPAAFLVALQKLADTGTIVLEGAFVRLSTHVARMTEADELLWEKIAPLLSGEARFRPPRVRDVAAITSISEGDVRRVMKIGARAGRVDQIAHDHFFSRPAVREMVEIAADLSKEPVDGLFSAAQFRNRVDSGRKVAIQILDFFDRHGITLKRGDHRRTNRYRLDLFGSDGVDGRESSLVGRSDFKSE